ncbi:MAG: preprotein translocase subunit SecG [Calditrichaeota bacterium]|nr:preprotein translocase subunit SecG [Calditrichota bacterium]
MIIVKSILLFIHVIISLLLIVTILLQASKGGGLSGTFGGQSSTGLLGSRGTASALSTVTKYLAGGFLLLSLTLSMMAGAGGKSVESVTQKVLQQTPASQLPAVQDLDFSAPVSDESDFETESE